MMLAWTVGLTHTTQHHGCSCSGTTVLLKMTASQTIQASNVKWQLNTYPVRAFSDVSYTSPCVSMSVNLAPSCNSLGPSLYCWNSLSHLLSLKQANNTAQRRTGGWSNFNYSRASLNAGNQVCLPRNNATPRTHNLTHNSPHNHLKQVLILDCLRAQLCLVTECQWDKTDTWTTVASKLVT